MIAANPTITSNARGDLAGEDDPPALPFSPRKPG
jgi:hypothetical protein